MTDTSSPESRRAAFERKGLRVVKTVVSEARTYGLLSSEQNMLVALHKLHVRSPLEALRLALTEGGEPRIRRKVNQTEVYDSIDGYLTIKSPDEPESAGAACRKILSDLCKRGFVSQWTSRPFVEGRLTQHTIYELSPQGIEAAKAFQL
jgi:hypothetical protein